MSEPWREKQAVWADDGSSSGSDAQRRDTLSGMRPAQQTVETVCVRLAVVAGELLTGGVGA